MIAVSSERVAELHVKPKKKNERSPFQGLDKRASDRVSKLRSKIEQLAPAIRTFISLVVVFELCARNYVHAISLDV